MVSLLRGNFQDARHHCVAARGRFVDQPQPVALGALIEFFDRRFEKAKQLYDVAIESNRTGGVEFIGSVRFLSAIGFILHNSGVEPQGTNLLEEALAIDQYEISMIAENPERLYSLAANHSALGNHDSAFASLDKAITAGWIDYRSIELDPRFDSIRGTKQFQEILSRLKDKVKTLRQSALNT
jgi:tetratricopeptide (TPR) repeat protein